MENVHGKSHIVVRMKHTLNSTRVTYNEDGFTLQLVNAQLHTLAKVAIARCYTQ